MEVTEFRGGGALKRCREVKFSEDRHVKDFKYSYFYLPHV